MAFPLRFFSATREMNTYCRHIAAPYIRKTFTAPDFVKAEITVTALGFYDLYLNSRKITKGILAPYISNPDDIVYYDKYDVTGLIRPGKNAVGLVLGNGMQNAIGGKGWQFDLALFRAAPKFAMWITYTFADGTATTVEADSNFKTHPSPLQFDDMRSGNVYDARERLDDWCSTEFDDSAWESVFPVESPRGEKRFCEAEPITLQKELTPTVTDKVYVNKDYRGWTPDEGPTQYAFDFKDEPGVLYDFGLNTAGSVRLKIKGEKGQKIYIQFCEFLNSKGLPTYRNICFYPDGYSQTIRFVCSGKEDVFEPQFTYFGARYALVYGLTDTQKTPDLLTFLVYNSNLEKRADFSCSDETANRLTQMTMVSDLANFYYFPTDCPHREKNGWTGDIAVSAEHLTVFFTAENSLREWLRNVCKAQNEAGALPCIVPTGGWGFNWGCGPAWDNALTEVCWQLYRLRGDLEPARECVQAMMHYLSYISTRRDEQGLIAIGLGDWVHPGRENETPKAPLVVTDSVITLYMANKSAELFNALGLKLQAEFAEKLARELKSAIRENLIDFTSFTVLSRCQTAQAICIHYGVFEQWEKKSAGEVLIRLVQEQKGHLDCGMIGLRVIFRVVADLGYPDLAYDMITRDDYPSYGSFVRRNLTALPERFLDEHEWDKPSSLNHHFFGDISAWFLEYVAGIRPVSANKCDIKPCFIEKLTHAQGDYQSPVGKISVRWEKSGDEITLSVEAPEETKGNIILPQGYAFVVPNDTMAPLHNTCFTPTKSGKYSVCKI